MTNRYEPQFERELEAYVSGKASPADRKIFEQKLAASPEMQQRLMAALPETLLVREAFDQLASQAPAARMQARLAAPARKQKDWRIAWRSQARPLRRMAALILAFLVGAAAGNLAPQLKRTGASAPAETSSSQESRWRQDIAEYLALYTAATFAPILDDREARQREIGFASRGLGLSLTVDQIAAPGAALKQAVLLDYEGRPLLQIAYLDPIYGPLVLCIISGPQAASPLGTDRAASPLGSEQREGLSILYWSGGGYRFMLAGQAPSERLMPLAVSLESRILN